ncbi:MAG: hypothetical protein IPJ09_00935 [Saprospiraceae bacterium]|nr:hypothetical protein [Saprospiraceae bacterium]
MNSINSLFEKIKVLSIMTIPFIFFSCQELQNSADVLDAKLINSVINDESYQQLRDNLSNYFIASDTKLINEKVVKDKIQTTELGDLKHYCDFDQKSTLYDSDVKMYFKLQCAIEKSFMELEEKYKFNSGLTDSERNVIWKAYSDMTNQIHVKNQYKSIVNFKINENENEN